MAEYGADTDYLDDNWIPRVWEARFGAFTWTSGILPFLPEEVEWEVKLDQTTLPNGAIPEKFTYPEETAKEEHPQPHSQVPAEG